MHKIKSITPWVLGALLAVSVAERSANAANDLTLVTSQDTQNANDSISWSQLGLDGTLIASSFNANSVGGLGVTGTLAASGSLVAMVCPATGPCSWTGGFSPADEVLWTSNTLNGGNGPLTLIFSQGITGGGAVVQSDTPGQFSVQIQAFNQSAPIGSFTETSNTNGDPIYIGVNNTFGSNITSLTFSLTPPPACPG